MYMIKDRVKIIATIGPATDDIEIIKQLIAAGVDVFRLNFSHGSHTWHLKNIEKIRLAAKELQTPVAIMADLQGPKVRITTVASGVIKLEENNTIRVGFSQDAVSDEKQLFIASEAAVFANLVPGNLLLLDDGKVALELLEKQSNGMICKVINSGQLTDRKGVSAFGADLNLPAVTDKDLEDIALLKDQEVDYIALSFVQTSDDITNIRTMLNNYQTRILAKFETVSAINNIESITEAADGIMVARGDLAVAIGAKRVPWLQKELLAAATKFRKPAIVATQMMESMITAAVPTRAEVSDVANAILDGADAVMLSAETAVGAYPEQVVKTVAKICLEANYHEQRKHEVKDFLSLQQVIAWSAVDAANKLKANCLVTLTETGSTALLFSKFGIDVPIIALTRSDKALGHMCLFKNVTPIYFDVLACGADIQNEVIAFLKERNIIKSGDTIILTKGGSLGVVGETNSMFILEV